MPELPNEPTLRDLQRYVDEMEDERGFNANSLLQKCLLLGEEVGELFKAVRKSHAGMRLATPGYEANPRDELADILILVCAIANRLEIDLDDAFREKEKINAERVWK